MPYRVKSEAALRSLMATPHKPQGKAKRKSKSQPLPEDLRYGNGALWMAFTLPVLTRSPNKTQVATRGGMMKNRRLNDKERQIAHDCTKARLPLGWDRQPLQFRVTLCRLSAGVLDEDNGVASFKHVQDGIADALGFADDSDPRLDWHYDQDKCKRGYHGVRVTIGFSKWKDV